MSTAERMMITDEQAVRTCLEAFVAAWQDDPGAIGDCLVAEPIAHISMFGHAFSGATVSRWLAVRPAGATLRLRIVNHVARVAGDTAAQYATIIGAFVTQGTYQHHLAFGGSFVNDLVRTADGWRIQMLRFDLQCEDSVGATHLSREGLISRAPGFGNASLIAGWLGIDDRIGHNMDAIPHTGALAVNPEFDAPWFVLPACDGTPTEEDQLCELLYKYCFAFDYATFYLLTDVFAAEATLDLDGEHMEGRRRIIGYLKMLRKSKPRSHHSVRFDEVRINGDTATVRATRITPDLRSHKILDESLDQWSDGTFTYTATKTDGAWQITSLSYEER